MARYLLLRAAAAAALVAATILVIVLAPASATPTISRLEERMLLVVIVVLLGIVSLAIGNVVGRTRRNVVVHESDVVRIQQSWGHVLQWPVSHVGALINVSMHRRPAAAPVLVATLLELALRGRYKLLPAQGDTPGFDVDLALAPGDRDAPVPRHDASIIALADLALESIDDVSSTGIALGSFGRMLGASRYLHSAALDSLEQFELALVLWMNDAGLLARPSTRLDGGAGISVFVSLGSALLVLAAAVLNGTTDWTAPLVLMFGVLAAAGGFIRLVAASPINRGLSSDGAALARLWRIQLNQIPAMNREDITMGQIDRSITHLAVGGRAREIALGAQVDDPWRLVAVAAGPASFWRMVRAWLGVRTQCS